MVFPKAAEAKPRRISVSGGHTITTPELTETTNPN
jgi:hypothetical protein